MIRGLSFLPSAALLLLATQAAFGFSAGPPIFATGVPVDPVATSCIRCHRGNDLNAPGGSLKVETFHYRPGQRQTVKVTIGHPEAARWGFQITARRASDLTQRAGSFVITPGYRVRCSDDPNGRDVTPAAPCPASALEFGEQDSTNNLGGSGGFKTYELEWTAPATDVGDVVFYVSGNAANGNFANTGDRIYSNAEAPFRIEPEGRPCPNPTRATVREVRSAASGGREVAMNTLISLYGTGFAAADVKRAAGPADFRTGRFPTELACVALEVAGQRVPITYVQGDQINAQLPAGVPSGSVLYRLIINPSSPAPLITEGSLTVSTYAPELFRFPGTTTAAGVALDGTYIANSSLGSGARPARPGEVVQLYATGLGPTEPVWQAGEFPDRASRTRETVTVVIGGITLTAADVSYAGIVPGAISGLYQINVRVPATATDGEWPVSLSVGGARSAVGVFIPVSR